MDTSSMRLLVKQIRWEAEAVVSLVLTDPAGAPLPGWRPGAHVDLRLPEGLNRQYSLCGDPDDSLAYRVAVLREPESRGGSRYLHEHLRAGTLVEVAGPRNHFPFEPAERIRFVAGGIGITPLLPMIREAQRGGCDWHLTYGGRTRAAMAFVDELPDARVSLARPTGTGSSIWRWPSASRRPAPRFTRAAQSRCCARRGLCAGWPAGALHLERFAVPETGAETRAQTTFEVEARRSGVTVTVEPGQSILHRLDEAGVFTISSCSEGICGACETKLLAGRPDHRDFVLTGEEKDASGTLLICVSRARSVKLVLDL